MHLVIPPGPFNDISEFCLPSAGKHWSLGAKALTLASLVNPIGLGVGAAALTVGTMALPVLGQPGKRSVPHVQIRKLQSGGKHAVIVVNGFLSQGDHDTADWEKAIRRKFRRATWYHLDWEAGRAPGKQLGDLLTLESLTSPMSPIIRIGANGLTAWHGAMLSAERTGVLLAHAIRSTPGWRFTLAGHSLGGRVIHFALKALAREKRKRIENVYLLGAAVGGGAKDDGCWEQAAGAVKGRIFNCYSREDAILSRLYRSANLTLSEPAGYSGINLQHARLFHFDCWRLVDGHLAWKSKFGSILEQLKEY